MSLATRCTSCNTAFRVVQDQLKVSEGWVRCGRCGTVFNALEALFDLDRDPLTEPGTPLDADPHEPGHIPPDGEADDAAPRHEEGADFLSPRRSERARVASAGVSHRDRNEFADAQFDPELIAAEFLLPEPEAKAQPDLVRASLDEERPELHKPERRRSRSSRKTRSAPDFIRHADARARWSTPRARWLLSLATLTLTTSLALQAAHHFRDEMAMRLPYTAAWLNHWCNLTGCRIEPPKRIADVVVDSTSLYRSQTAADVVQLAITLRNRGSTAVAMPSIDLDFRDERGQLVSRRVLSPMEFEGGTPLLLSGAEVPLRIHLSTANLPVVHYTVEPFYP